MFTLMSRTFGFKTLGPFYVMTQVFGVSLVREINNKVCCPKKSKFIFTITYFVYDYVILYTC